MFPQLDWDKGISPKIAINIFEKLKYEISFVDLLLKLRVVALLSNHSPKMAKISLINMSPFQGSLMYLGVSGGHQRISLVKVQTDS